MHILFFHQIEKKISKQFCPVYGMAYRVRWVFTDMNANFLGSSRVSVEQVF